MSWVCHVIPNTSMSGLTHVIKTMIVEDPPEMLKSWGTRATSVAGRSGACWMAGLGAVAVTGQQIARLPVGGDDDRFVPRPGRQVDDRGGPGLLCLGRAACQDDQVTEPAS